MGEAVSVFDETRSFFSCDCGFIRKNWIDNTSLLCPKCNSNLHEVSGQTKLFSFMVLKSVEDLVGKQLKVFDCFRDAGRPLTDKEVSLILGWPINCVTPRRGELQNDGFLDYFDTIIQPNKRPADRHFVSKKYSKKVNQC